MKLLLLIFLLTSCSPSKAKQNLYSQTEFNVFQQNLNDAVEQFTNPTIKLGYYFTYSSASFDYLTQVNQDDPKPSIEEELLIVALTKVFIVYLTHDQGEMLYTFSFPLISYSDGVMSIVGTWHGFLTFEGLDYFNLLTEEPKTITIGEYYQSEQAYQDELVFTYQSIN